MMLCSAAALVSAACFAETLVVGRFQPVGDVAATSLPLEGNAKILLEAIRIVDLSGRNPADLSVDVDLRVTRHDGRTDVDSLKYVRNGRLVLTDTEGAKVLQTHSPVQHGVAAAERHAGDWLAVSFPLAAMTKGSGRLASLELSEYNDCPKNGEPTGVTLEVRNARIVDRTREVWNTQARESAEPRTTCNPIDLSYMIQHGKEKPDGTREGVYIESADPALVVFQGAYWLFASHGEGYWVSQDMGRWEFIRVDVTKPVLSEFKRYAPATCVIGDTLYLCHSEGGRMLKTKNPRDPNAWEDVGKPDGWMDPGMFYNDPATGGDGYVYLYRGLSHRNPIEVLKLDPRQNMKKVEGPYDVAWPDMQNRGYEVAGDNNTNYDGKDTMEGPWPVKYNGRYYITCAVPGTQYASYADNCFVADEPMGPFVFCPNSPVVWKSTGFTQGAGHGGLFQDLNGHWWKVDSCRTTGFNRRLVLVPSMFDDKGDLYSNTMRSDFPFFVPGRSSDPFGRTGPNWNLLSYGKKATASSNGGSAFLAFNESMTDAWVAGSENAGEWLQVDLGKIYGVWSVQINFMDLKSQVGGRDNIGAYHYLLEGSLDGRTWYPLVDRQQATDNRQHAYVEFAEKVGARYVRLTNKGPVPGCGKLAVSGLRVFGEGGGKAPAPVDMDGVYADRRAHNNRTVGIEWPAADGAQGYIVRYGTAPDRLHTHFQVFGRLGLIMNTLNRGVDYWYTVDAFNESGVTPGPKVLKLPATEPMAPGYDPDNTNPAVLNRIAGRTCEAEAATARGGLTTGYEVRASGVKVVRGFGAKNHVLTFGNVPGSSSNASVLRLCYAAQYPVTIQLTLNGRVREIVLPKTKGWVTFETFDLPVADVKDVNEIVLQGLDKGRVSLDWLALVDMHPRKNSHLPANSR